MKNSDGLSDSIPSVTKSPAKCEKCGATARLHTGVCVRCLLGEGLETGDEVSRAVFESVIAEVDVPDKQWRLGDYEILDEIGRGGMGVIYLARQRHPHRIVAVKRVLNYHADSHETLVRFRREADAAASLDHPNILPIYEVSESEDGLPFFSMKFAAGGSLRKIGPALHAEPRQCVQLMAKVARAIEYANGQGILHRDLKPGNVLLDDKGEPLVSDFGLAKWLDTNKDLTKSLIAFGTPGYTAPEQAEGKAADLTPAADVYSLGAILFDLLAGRPPFLGANPLSVIRQASETPAPKLRSLAHSHDRDLETICARCLERDPKARYQSAGDLATDLERWLDGRPIIARPVSAPARIWRWSQRNPKLITTGASCLLLGAAAIWLFRGELFRASQFNPPEKSIAVLPFENLSDEKEHAFFADGVQDDILIKLAKIADLKVISRTSVMQYRGKHDVRQIGDALSVSHVLEGTVRRSGGKVHVNAQLVDTRTDADIWAEEYDRNLNDVFAIETEVAQSIASRLRAKVSTREKAAMQEWPTRDLVAYDLYTRAKNILEVPNATQKDLLQRVDLLNQAVARDPSFFDAYCQLAYAHDDVYNEYVDHTSARLALAEAAIQAAARLRPDAGETHLARALNLYWGYWDYDGALAELKIVRRTLPNDFRIPQMTAHIQNRQGQLEESTRNLERAAELNPRNLELRVQITMYYTSLRRYADVKSALASTLAVFPNDLDTRIWPAYVEFQAKADTRPLHQMLDSIRARNPAAIGMPGMAEWSLACALAERDATAAKNALDAHSEDPIVLGNEVFFSRSSVEGLIARMKKDEGKARSAFVAAHAEQEKVLEGQPNNSRELGLLGLIDAYLGRKEEALREGRRAVELVRAEKDVSQGVGLVTNLAMIAACVGDKDLAFEELDSVIRLPSPLSYGGLKLFPWWDPLRGDPRFEKLLEEAKQPVVLK
jgi:serine/threonine protein kinase/tetratricopeptide (TPR) repeat protein